MYNRTLLQALKYVCHEYFDFVHARRFTRKNDDISSVDIVTKFARDVVWRADRFTMYSLRTARTVLQAAELSTRAGLDGRFDKIFGEELRKTLIDFVDENVDDLQVFSHVRDAVDRANSYDE